jgi:single-strand DNA-binding protein
MASFNSVVLMGNLCRDPELRFTPSGLAIASISLAINRKWKDANGELKEEVSFIDCTAFGKTAEVAGQYVKKGNPLHLSGRLKQEQWDDKQTGQKRSKIVVIVDSLQLMGGKREDSDSAPPRQPSKPASQAAPANDAPAEDPDNVPF